jgi:leucyl/phenylalanyl-tRNA--protein transferase
LEDFTVDDLIACYERGVFPMADSRHDEDIFLVDPDRRGIFPLDQFHIPRRLARSVRAEPYQVRIDTAFDAVVRHCAMTNPNRPDRQDTWINGPIESLYGELFQRGLAHSVECWQDGKLVGGLYGVTLGAAFFGESMFSLSRDASKIALVHLVARLKLGRFQLLDAQFMTDHLAQFGAIEINRIDYKRRLGSAVISLADFYRLPAYAAGAEVLQAINHAS